MNELKCFKISTSVGKDSFKHTSEYLIHGAKSESDATTSFLNHKYPTHNPHETFQNFHSEINEISREEFTKNEEDLEVFNCN